MDHPLLKLARERVIVIDGAMGTSIYSHDLSIDKDYRGCENCTDIVSDTRPEVIEEIHAEFLRVGCDCVETNTFGANMIVLGEFDLADQTYALNKKSVEVARRAADKFSTPDRPRFVLGSMGPGTKLPTLGHTTFDILEDSYAEQARGLIDGGADALIIETCQDILQAKSAICGATLAMHEKSRQIPILVQVTIEVTGTMLVGTEIGAALVALESFPQVQVIGINCATGPQEMSEHVRYLCRTSSRLISVVPNAGLPQLVDGKTHYALTPAELAKWLKEFVVADGVNVVGGCCGTTPAHLAAVVEAVHGLTPKKREPQRQPSCSSIYQPVTLRQDNSFLIVGERSNTNGSKKFRELLVADDINGLVDMGREQVREGAHVLDVCVDYVGRDGVPDMDKVVSRYVQDVTVPLMLDSTEWQVLEAGLKRAGGKCIVNSVNLEDGEEKLERVCPLLRKYGAAVVALTIDEDPTEAMAKVADRKIEIASRLHKLLTTKYGISEEDILFDCLTFPITTGNEADRRLALETLDGIERIMTAFPRCGSILGLSNVSFGLLPVARAVLNSVFLHEAMQRGLTAAIVHASKILPRNKISDERWNAALDLIYDRRREGFDPLQSYIKMFDKGEKVGERKKSLSDLPIEERLKQRIIDGERIGLEGDLDEARGNYKPLEIINTFLLDGMKVVGELFGAGKMQLPFVLSSAETMKAAVGHLEPYMEKVEGDSKGTIILATVKGDVHDIGKNLVDIILSNNGFTVHNLGIKQPIANVIEAFQKHNADAIGLSGLLVKSTLVMRDDLEVLNERSLTMPVILGGAALTRGYVENDLRAIYNGPVSYAKDAFEGLALMRRLSEGLPLIDESKPVHIGKKASASSVVAVPANVARSAVAIDNPIPTPPFWGSRVIERINLQTVMPYINEKMLFGVQWQYTPAGRKKDEYDAYIRTEVRPILHELAKRCAQESVVVPQAIYGYWPANSEGQDLIVYEPPQQPADIGPGKRPALKEIARFTFPRQTDPPYWCLSDFFRPVSSGEYDVAAFHIVTVGRKASEVARQWFEQNLFRDYLHLHGFSVEATEALAEYMHKQIRMELAIAEKDAREVRRLFQQGYQGSRYSFGYPACPNLEDQAKLWPLMEPGRIEIELSEEFQLEPEQSTSAIIAHHPEARYFNVRGAKTDSQLAARIGEV